MKDQDLFKPCISLWQYYTTMISVACSCLAGERELWWVGVVAVVLFFGGAAVERYVDARRERRRG